MGNNWLQVHTGPRIGDMRTFIEQLHDRRLAEIILSLIQRMNVINQGFQSYHSGVERFLLTMWLRVIKHAYLR